MENNRKDRTQLKSYFKTNAVPTEQNFKDFIDANLNQKEDGIAKIPNGALAIQSAGATEELIHFYKSFDDANPTWRLSQKPADAAGFNIADGAGTSRLFIDSGTGNTGLSVSVPQARLDVAANDANGVLIRSGNGSDAFARSQLTLGYNGTAQYRHAIKTRHNAGALAGNAIDFYVWKYGTDGTTTIGTQQVMTLDGNGNVGIGMTNPSAKLQITPSGGSNPTANGIYVFNQANSADQDAIVCVRSGGSAAGNPYLSLEVANVSGWAFGIDNKDNQALKFSNAVNSLTSATKMTLTKNGDLGIGTTTPAGRLDVNVVNQNGVVIRSGNTIGNSSYANSQLSFGWNGNARHMHSIRTRHDSGTTANNSMDFFIWKPGDANEGLASQQALTLTGEGKAGIGILAPTAKLHVMAGGKGNPAQNGVYVYNTNAGEDAIVGMRTNNKTGGNPFVSFDIDGIGGWSIGIDNSDSQKLKFSSAWDNIKEYAKVTFDREGRVGIGLTAPRYPLHVRGSVNSGTTSGNGAMMDKDKYDNGWDSGRNADISIFAENVIATRTYFACHENFNTSDARIKNIVGRSNVQEDLATLMQLRVTDYSYIDTRTHGNAVSKKIVAQEVEEVYPQAVRRRTETLPDIYAPALTAAFDAQKRELTLEMSKATGLAAGDRVDLVDDENGRNQYTVVRAEETTFTVTCDTALANVFVYGKQVDDFRFVDYDSLFMLGISSIQALNGEVSTLKQEVSALKQALATYSA